MLAARNLTIDISKTEEYKISRINCEISWKNYKLLGSSPERKGLTINALHNVNNQPIGLRFPGIC